MGFQTSWQTYMRLTWGPGELHGSGPQPFWHQGPVSWKTIFPRTGAAGVGDGSGGNASDGERYTKLCLLCKAKLGVWGPLLDGIPELTP